MSPDWQSTMTRAEANNLLLPGRIARANLVPRHKELGFAAWRTDYGDEYDDARIAAFKAARAYATDIIATGLKKARNMILMGNTGCGKTHLAHAIIVNLAMMGFEIRRENYWTMTRNIRSTYGRGSQDDETESTILDLAGSIDVLLLDDLGPGALHGSRDKGATDHERRIARDIINMRDEAALPTIATINLKRGELETWFGETVAVSRFFHGAVEADLFGMPDMRDAENLKSKGE